MKKNNNEKLILSQAVKCLKEFLRVIPHLLYEQQEIMSEKEINLPITSKI